MMKRRLASAIAAIVVQLHAGECDIVRYGEAPISETETETYTAEGSLFSLAVPKGWGRSTGHIPYASAGATSVGVLLRAPADALWVQPEISVIYYGNGGFFADYRDYIRLKRQSFDRRDDDGKTAMSEVIAGGKKGVAFEIRTVEAGSSASLFEEGIMYRIDGEKIPKMVRTIESFRIFPVERGFFVLHYKASEASAPRCSGVFERVVQSIRFGVAASEKR